MHLKKKKISFEISENFSALLRSYFFNEIFCFVLETAEEYSGEFHFV